jgi:outer membrane protein assembly factor BamD (BamD/ComL family)
VFHLTSVDLADKKGERAKDKAAKKRFGGTVAFIEFAQAFDQAKHANTDVAFEQFLKKYPTDPSAPSRGLAEETRAARTLLDRLQWDAAQQKNTPESYAQYVKQQANGEFKAQATGRAEEVAWKDASGVNSHEAYAGFVKNYPKGRFSVEAQGQMTRIERESGKVTVTLKKATVSSRSQRRPVTCSSKAFGLRLRWVRLVRKRSCSPRG